MIVGDSGDVTSKQAGSEYGWDKLFAEYKGLNAKFEVPNEEQNRYELCTGSTTTCI